MTIAPGDKLEDALKMVRDTVFTKMMGARDGVPKIAILVTDGVQVSFYYLIDKKIVGLKNSRTNF